jgi:hypothetical protein
LAKEKSVVVDKKEEEPRKMKCFRCREYGHHQRDCVNLPIRYKCKEEGHMVVECTEIHVKAGELKIYGFAILEQGFYIIQTHGTDEARKTSCIIQVLQGDASMKNIEDELKNLIDSKWKWQVKQVDTNEFTVVFPNKSSLGTFSKTSKMVMSLHGIKVKFLKSNNDPEAIEVLHTTWVKIYGLPTIAYKEEVIMKIATLAGEPLLVDELSLIKDGPVRVKLNCRDPLKLRAFVRIFFNRIGYEIHFVSEKYKVDKPTFPPSPPRGDDEGGGRMRKMEKNLKKTLIESTRGKMAQIKTKSWRSGNLVWAKKGMPILLKNI